MRSALATGIVVKPAVRSVQAKAGLKVYARMTKDRVSLKKDSKWRSDINIYPVRCMGPNALLQISLPSRIMGGGGVRGSAPVSAGH